MKSLLFVFLICTSLFLIISCGDSNTHSSTGPTGVNSTKLDTLDSPKSVWIDTAAIYIDSVKYFFQDTIKYEVHKLDDSGNLYIDDSTEIIVSGTDTLIKNNEPSGMIRVNWSPVEEADVYYILVADTGNADVGQYWKIPLKADSTNTDTTNIDKIIEDAEGNLSYIIRGLSPEYSYDAYVFGYNLVKKERGARTKSDRSVHLKGSPSPTTITVDIYGNTANIKWSAVEDVRKYNVIVTNILTDSSNTYTTIGDETSIQVAIENNSAYKVRIVPEGFVVVSSALDSILIDLGPSFTKIDTIYPYDPTVTADSSTMLFPHVLFSTFNEYAANDGLVPIKGGYFLKGDIWSVTARDSLQEVVLSSFNISKSEVSNKMYVEFLNELIKDGIALSDSQSGDTILDTIISSVKTLWESTFTGMKILDSTNKVGDTISIEVPVSFSVIHDSIIYDTITAIDSAYFLDTITFKIYDGGDVYYKTITQEEYVLSSIMTDSIFTLNDTITMKVIFSDSLMDTIRVDTTFIDTVRCYDTISTTYSRYSSIGIEGKKYLLLQDNSRIRLKSETIDSVVKVTAVIDSSLLLYPVKGVSWEGSVAYCNWLSDSYGYDRAYVESNDSIFTIDSSSDGFRLPTETEYEYVQSAAFLGTKQKYSWGSSIKGITVTLDSLKEITELKEYFGITGLTGNVLEWCSDNVEYSAISDVSTGIVYDPITLSGTDHVIKGGAFNDGDKINTFMSSYNLTAKPVSLSAVGFRVARWPR